MIAAAGINDPGYSAKKLLRKKKNESWAMRLAVAGQTSPTLSELEEICYAKSSSLVLGSARILRALFGILPRSFYARQDAEHCTLEACAIVCAARFRADPLLRAGAFAYCVIGRSRN